MKDISTTIRDDLESRLGDVQTILNERAEWISKDLSEHYSYVEFGPYLETFQELHLKHMNALSEGNIPQALQVLAEIHSCSKELDGDESLARWDVESPGAILSLPIDIFTRGALICAYIIGEMESNSPDYPSFTHFKTGHLFLEPITDYLRILDELPPVPDEPLEEPPIRQSQGQAMDDEDEGSPACGIIFPILLVALVGCHLAWPHNALLKYPAHFVVLVFGFILSSGLHTAFSKDKSWSPHFGYGLLVVIIGVTLSIWFGWVSTGIVLAVCIVLGAMGALQNYMGRGQ